MRQITDKLLQSLYRIDLSKYEYITLIELLQACDASGKVVVHYSDIVDKVGCSIATFYNSINNLEKLSFISKGKNEIKSEIEITIKDNYFCDDHTDSNYVNLNITFFESKLYKQLSAGGIRLFFYLLFRVSKAKHSPNPSNKNQGKNKLSFNDSYKSISDSIGITIRMLKIYIKELKDNDIICFAEKKVFYGKRYHDVITVAHKVLSRATINVTTKGVIKNLPCPRYHSYFKHIINVLCRRANIYADNQNIEDAAMLMTQYNNTAKKKNKDICKIIQSAFRNLQESVLDSRILHAIIKQLVHKNYEESIIL